MEINPFIPIVAMAIICVALGATCIGCRSVLSIIRRVLIIAMLFMINLRMVIPGNAPDVKIKSSDVHVLFVVDDTISMLGDDYKGTIETSDGDSVTRLDGAKRDCKKIIEGLNGAKFSVISFHNTANINTPYTDNSEHAISVINALYPLQAYYANGTTINVVKDLLLTQLKKTYEEKNKKTIVFFITDGEITASNDSLGDFSELAQYISDGGVLGYGTTEGGHMSVRDEFSTDQNVVYDPTKDEPATTYIDETNLNQLAKDMGIPYYNMNEGWSLTDKISQMRTNNDISTEIVTSAEVEGDYTDDTPIYFIFVGVLVLLLGWEMVMIRRKA